jgi:glycosyltransferase involved in cell wall biosynthesis
MSARSSLIASKYMNVSKTSLRIAVDLTPLRPSGENGGAKHLVLALLKQFQALAPSYYFLILTAPWNHSELAQFDAENTERLLVDNLGVKDSIFNKSSRLSKLIKKISGRSIFLSKLTNKIASKLISLSKLIQKIVNKFSPSVSSLKKRNINLLFCPFSAPTYAERDIPLVAIVYDLQHLDYPFFFTSQEKQHRTKFLTNLLQKSQKIICISNFTSQSLITHFQASKQQLTVVPICIHNRLSKPSESSTIELLEYLGLNNHKYAFYPANYWQHKNHRVLLTAYGIYKRELPNQPLDLVFTGALKHEEDQLRKAASIMGLSNSIHFLGFLSDNELASVWQSAECLIFPSLYEGFGIPVLEAMRFGKPVLSSNAGSLPEVAGDAALYFDPRKPLEIALCLTKISSDPSLVDGLIEKGFQRLKIFNDEEMSRKYLSIFEAEAVNFPIQTLK